MKIGDYVAFEPPDGNIGISQRGSGIVHMSQPGVVVNTDINSNIKVDFGQTIHRILNGYWCRAADCRVIDAEEFARLTALAVLGCL